MNDNKKSSAQESNVADKDSAKDQFLERWQDSDKNRMGNDIASEIKIANSKGEQEGGEDKRWHMDTEE